MESDMVTIDEPRSALHDVVRTLGPDVVHAAHLPRRAVAVSDVLLYDPTDSHSIRTDAIVLAIGLTGVDGDAEALLHAGDRHAAAAVVFRTERELPDRLVALGAQLDVAVLAIPLHTAWGQLYSLLRSALASAGTAGRVEVAGVPVGDLFALADATAAAVGGAVTIEDPRWRVLAYSNLGHPIDDARRDTILGRTPPLVWQRHIEETGVGRALRSGSGVVHVDGGPAPRLVAPVRAGSELLGSIWVAEGDRELGADAEHELATIAERATVHLLSHRAYDDIKRRVRGSFVREVLEGHLGPRAERDVIGSGGPFTVLAFQSEPGPGGANPERILSIVSLYSENAHPEAMCALIDDRLWAVVPVPGGRERERSVELAQRVVTSVESVMPVRLRVGIGGSVPSVADVPRSRHAAEQALRVLVQRGGGASVVHIQDVRAHAVLLDLLDRADERPGMRDGRLGDLLAADPAHADQHRDTLRAYLDCSGNVAKAARRLGVHANTLRYRVRRAVEVSGLDLDDPDERLVTELQLRMRA
jgi:hypothetical protein